MASQSLALPGQILGPTSKYIPGPGTHVHNSQICASLAGIISQFPTNNASSAQSNGTKAPHAQNLPTISVANPTPSTTVETAATQTTLPTVHATTLSRITRLTPRHATVSILSLNKPPTSLPPGITGLIRQQDIRATQKDTVKVSESFRVGDIVRAVVISLGDGANYYLSTAGNELGVVVARSEAGNLMGAVSWCEMRDCVTGTVEGRKVARPG